MKRPARRRPATPPPPPPPGDFLQAVGVYRSAVCRTAAAGGQLPPRQLRAVVAAAGVIGIPVDQFDDDVDAWKFHAALSARLPHLFADQPTPEALRLALASRYSPGHHGGGREVRPVEVPARGRQTKNR